MEVIFGNCLEWTTRDPCEHCGKSTSFSTSSSHRAYELPGPSLDPSEDYITQYK